MPIHPLFDDDAVGSEAEQLEAIAAIMNNLRQRADAELSYDMLSDALVWTDEWPDVQTLTITDVPRFYCLRSLLYYRTTLILAKPEQTKADLWAQAMRAFPCWAGFAEERRQHSDYLVERFYAFHTAAFRSIERYCDIDLRRIGPHEGD